ncbi:MAG: ABC transporter substrate-binding protein [Zoogloea oleivorans]|jgi:ABC-type transport system substrate-binding protein|uniref:Peptide ABC transporter substrate-binding protein n=2 Tax=Zoogloea oleivorans TaxID=1552750 RepID=A0A6C2C9X3_9RHOO|nr:ABC transporter substrate-binding protein [Zoogloea oleivorans]MDY0034819.1 ABC transporter substrate-binding protein [Zoogloea oleivorans]TYC50737.1 peptide ABC transporter substrate-binding protein [Zoogloea oleivorans]
MRAMIRNLSIILLAALAAGCGQVWNDPYPATERGKNILYSAFTQRPKHLDPVQSYSEDEATFLYQIYEPPLQYHYLKRPFQLSLAAAQAMPTLKQYDEAGQLLPSGADPARVARSEYEIRIKPGIRYQPHPAFAVDDKGQPAYLDLTVKDLTGKRSLADFPRTGTRELTAEDYVYQIKRLAHPRLHSPVLELMGDYIVGLKDLHARLMADEKAGKYPGGWIDLRKYPMSGLELVDRYTYRVHIKGAYPQFPYWLAMPFFAPVPFEAERFFAQPGMAERNLTLDWWPIGTGPFMLAENNPNARMVLVRNPNFRGETYPCEGEPEDQAAGLLADCNKPVPFIDKVVFTREKESIPYWNKFLQGYYDASGVSSDNFDQAVQMGGQGDVSLSDEMVAKDIRLNTSVAPSVMYMGFNMLDPTVGGTGERARKLRLAISIAIDQEEFISVFQNGRGVPAMHPIPPGIFGYRSDQAGINPQVYDWVDGKPQRKSVEEARSLLAEAGYPGGRDAKSGEPLVVNLDTTGSGMGDKSTVDWLTKQFRKLDVQLVVRATDYNRFQDKIRKGNAQLFYWGWNADYPDPENFLFLLYGAQGKVKSQGENAANYENAEYDRLFERMKAMPDSPARQAIIERMLAILQHDAPWVWGFYEKAYALQHGWLYNRKPGKIIRNTLKYQRVDVAVREQKRAEWNRPVLWPLIFVGLFGMLIVAPAVIHYRRSERAGAG